jgi:mannose/fructose/N-acetylgalactosamine-specific phosphotransferase system component IIB
VNADGAYYDSDNPLPITGAISTTPGATYYASDAIGSVNLVQIGGEQVTQGPGEELMALRIVHASDAIASVNLNQTAGNPTVVGTGYQDNALRVVEATDSIASVNLNTVNGAAVVVGTGYQDNALRVVHATDAIASVNIAQTMAALDVIQVSGSIWSVYLMGATGTTAIVGDVAPGSANVNSPPVRIGGVVTQTNPTAIADGNIGNFRMDDLGRQITRPVQVRDLIATAYVSVTNGTETTLKAGVAGAYLDCIMLVGSNASDAAVSVDIRAVTAGNIVHTLRIPANGTAGWAPSVPWPQDETGNNWTVDGPDETGRTLTFSALFSKET